MNALIRILILLYLFFVIIPEYVFASQPAAVQTETQEGTSEAFQYKLNIPTFSGLNSKSFQKKLNVYYETNILSFQKQLEKQAKHDFLKAKEDGVTLHPYVVNTDYKVTLNEDTLLSLYVMYYQYTGGAHGMYDWRANTFDTETKKELQLQDLFQKDSNYLSIIQQEIARQIQQNNDEYFPDAAAQAEKTKQLRFFLEPDHLVVYFSLYEIAPYASGIPQFRIPYTALREELKDKYANILLK